MKGTWRRSRTGHAERIKQPFIFRFVVSKDVDVAVIGAHTEASIADAIPLVKDLDNLKRPGPLRTRAETQRTLVGLVTGVALNMEDHRHKQAHGESDDQFPPDRLGKFVHKRNRLDRNARLNQNTPREV